MGSSNGHQPTTERTVDLEGVRAATRALLEAIGENPDRPGLIDTPDRVARAWGEFINYRDSRAETTFNEIRVGDLVMVRGIDVWSMCEHHLLPFRCRFVIAYRPTLESEVLGLSKFARIAQKFAHRLQLQEQLTTQIGQEIERVTKVRSVAVLGQGEHLCMVSRGIKARDAEMFTTYYSGSFGKIEERQEFLTLASWNPLD